MTTADDIRAALHKKYVGGVDREGEAYVCIEEARSGAGFSGNNGACDFLAINTWESRGMELIGHEIKVSYTDWRKELAKPEKAERFSRFCKRWYIVIPAALREKIDHEVPTNWGLMTLSDKGALREVQKPVTNRSPEAVPAWWWIGWLAQIDRQHKRRLPYLVQEKLKPERERMERLMNDHAERRAAAQDDRALQRLADLDAFETATGFRVSHAQWDLDKIGQALKLIRNNPDLGVLAGNLRKTADMFDGLLTNRDALLEADTDD